MVQVRKSVSVRAAWAAALAGAALASWTTLVVADGAKPQSDDKCVARCDEQTDKCMLASGKDSQKQRACDSEYDECLRKCS